MSDAAQVISALAALAWPLVLAIFLWQFKSELAGLLHRLREVSGPGVSGKFDPALNELDEKARAASEAVPVGTEQRDDSSLQYLPHHPAAVLFEHVLDASPSRFVWTTTMLGLHGRDFSGADASLDRRHPSWERDEAVRSEGP